MRILLYVFMLAAALAFPVERTDVGKLRPVEVVAVAQTETGFAVRTDTGDRGTGQTLGAAFRDLEDSTAGVIYLDTAEYLLLETPVKEQVLLRELLKNGVRVCAAEPEIDLEGTGAYLDVHRPQTRLRDDTDYQELEVLRSDGERLRLQ